MVVLTAATVGAVVAAPVVLPAAAAAGATAGAGAGIGTAGIFAITAAESAAAVAGVGTAGAAAGAVTGAIAGGSTAAAAAGSVTGAAIGAGVTSAISGSAGVVAGIASGPVGWLCLGASSDEDSGMTWDCWKPILHDKCQKKSKGILFKDIVNDSRIKMVVIGNLEDEKCFPKITVMNNWDEQFDILPVELPNGHIALHAELILE